MLFSLVLSMGAIAQDLRYKDSLINVLEAQYLQADQRVVDTVFLHLLNELTFEYIFFNPDSAIYFGNKTALLAQKPEHYRYLGNALMYQGLAYDEKQNLTMAIEYAEKACNLFLLHGDSLSYAKALVNKSNSQKEIRDYTSALEGILIAKDIAKKNGHSFFYYQCITNLGNLYLSIGELELAEKYTLEAYETYKNKNFKRGLIVTLPNLARINSKRNLPFEAIKFAQENVKLTQEINDPFYSISAKIELSKYYLDTDKPLHIVLAILNEAIEKSKALNNNKFITIARIAKAETYLKFNKYEQALKELNILSTEWKMKDDIKQLADFYFLKAKALRMLNRNEKALEALIKHKKYSDSLSVLMYNDDLKFLNLQQLQREQKLMLIQKEVNEQQLDLQKATTVLLDKRNSILFWLSLLFLFIISLLVYFFIKINSIKRRLFDVNKKLTHERNLFRKGPVIAFHISNPEKLIFSYLSENVQDFLSKLNYKGEYHKIDDLIANKAAFRQILNTHINAKKNEFCIETQLESKTNKRWCNLIFKAIYKKDELVALTGFIVDNDDAVQLNASLEHKKALLDSTCAIGKVGAWRYDAVNNKAIASEQALKIINLKNNEELDLEKALSLFDNQESINKIHTLYLDLSPENNSFDSEFKFTLPNGKNIIARIIARAKFKDGKLISSEGSVIDISEFKLQQAELEKALDLTDKQNKRLKNFTHIVSHNLKSYSGNYEMVLHLIADKDNVQDEDVLIKALEKNTKRFEETLHHLNEVVKVQSNLNIAFKEIRIRTEIDKIIDSLIDSRLEEIPDFKINVPNKYTLKFVPAYLESVLYNLVNNAIKYRHPDRQLQIEISIDEHENYDVINVKDNGLGIDLQKHGDKLFGMYKTFHQNKDARGIGLFLSKNQIEFTGGKLEVQSKPGEGSTFSVFIPKNNQNLHKLVE
jgi:signal transduction histidine kinase